MKSVIQNIFLYLYCILFMQFANKITPMNLFFFFEKRSNNCISFRNYCWDQYRDVNQHECIDLRYCIFRTLTYKIYKHKYTWCSSGSLFAVFGKQNVVGLGKSLDSLGPLISQKIGGRLEAV